MFDVRAHCKNLEFGELTPFLRRMTATVTKCGYFWTSAGKVLSTCVRVCVRYECTRVVGTQAMTLRTNCLDCLDR
jgi:hypothetical protein